MKNETDKELKAQLKRVLCIVDHVSKFVKSAVNSAETYKNEMKRLKRADSMQNYELVSKEYKQSIRRVTDLASKVKQQLADFESSIKVMPPSMDKSRMLDEIKSAKRKLRRLNV